MKSRLLALIAPACLALSPAAAHAAGDPIMPLAQVQPGMDCTGETVVQGTSISSFAVHVIDIVQQRGQGTRILIRVSGPAVDTTGVAEGFSGSPVYCTDSGGEMRNAGAISEGVGEYGNKVALVTPIEQMLGEPVTPPSSAPHVAYRTRALAGPLTIAGVSPWLQNLFGKAARRAGRSVLAAPGGPAPSFAVQPLVPGASVGVSYAAGDIGLGAVGTVTYRDGNTVYAFGHPLDGAGRRSLLLQDAYVYDVVNNPNVEQDTSYKLATFGHTEGTLTSDAPNAVVGRLDAGPPLIPVDVTARDLDTGDTLAQHTDVADETDVGLPTGSSGLDLIGPLAIAQAATQIYDGAPANQSGSMCFRIDLRESSTPLQFCNRYVGSGGAGDGGLAPPALASTAGADVSTGLGLLDSVRFAALHVTHVTATINARRGLLEAEIVRARAPRVVRAGQSVLVRLRVQVYRGPARTISFPISIPADAHGSLDAVLRGPAGDSTSQASSGAAALLVAALTGSMTGGGEGPSAQAPASIGALTRLFSAISRYDGLVVGFSSGGRRVGRTKRAYRDPLLLLTGRTTLRFVVR